MAGPNRTQKQIAEKYKGNLDYFRRGHYLRRLRLFAFLIAVVASLAAVFGYRYWGKPELFSTGPISENHARFANDCQVCHEGANPDLVEVLRAKKVNFTADGVTQIDIDKITKSAGEAAGKLDAKNLRALAEQGIAYTSLSLMDRSCLKCHEPMGLHQPQSAPLALKSTLKALPVVHAFACSTCHREHIGHQRMKLPTSESCESCHNNADELARTRELLKLPKSNPPTRAENRDLGDGLVRFIPPAKKDAPHAFKNYADGHPPFGYEAPNLRDPAHLKYNHWRHEQGDIPQLNGHQLRCADCHQPGGNGVRYQPVDFEKHCYSCHSLHIDPDLPEVRIPHGDPEKVRDFLRPDSLTLHFAEAFRARGVSDRLELGTKIKAEFDHLADRGMTTAEELERRVFFVGDPPVENERNTPKSNRTPFFASCAKCHDLERTGGVPRVMPTNMAQQWVQRGPFTHVPHAHMQCTDCHGAAKTSKLTSDILMPPQKLCAECHRPLDKKQLEHAQDTLKLRAELKPGSSDLAEAQRRAGGVKEDCQSCHVFHAPPAATIFLQTQKN